MLGTSSSRSTGSTRLSQAVLLASGLLSISVTGCGSSSARVRAGLSVEMGTATVIRAGKSTQYEKGAKVPLEIGDTIRAGANSQAQLFEDGHAICLAANAELIYQAAAPLTEDDPPMVVTLVRGLSTFMIDKGTKKHKGDKFLAVTHSVIAAVKGTAFEGNVSDSGAVDFTLTEGRIVLRSPEGAAAFAVERMEDGVDSGESSDVADGEVGMVPGQKATVSAGGDATAVSVGTPPQAEYQAARKRVFELGAMNGATIMNF